MTNSKLVRLPKGLTDYVEQQARLMNTKPCHVYRQIELALKGIDSIGTILAEQRKNDKKPPFRF